MALSAFGPTGYAGFYAMAGESAAVALPTAGTPTTVLVTNIGGATAVVLLGDNSVTVAANTGVAINPGDSLPLTIGGNTHLAGIGVGGNTTLNLAVGS